MNNILLYFLLPDSVYKRLDIPLFEFICSVLCYNYIWQFLFLTSCYVQESNDFFFWKKEYIWHDATFEIQIYNCSHLMLNGLILLLMLTTSMVRICTPVLLSCDRAWSTLWSIFRWQSCLCAKRTVYAEFLIIQESVTYTLQLGGPVENLLMRRNSMLMFEETARHEWV